MEENIQAFLDTGTPARAMVVVLQPGHLSEDNIWGTQMCIGIDRLKCPEKTRQQRKMEKRERRERERERESECNADSARTGATCKYNRAELQKNANQNTICAGAWQMSLERMEQQQHAEQQVPESLCTPSYAAGVNTVQNLSVPSVCSYLDKCSTECTCGPV
jgi:hypothetical protein